MKSDLDDDDSKNIGNIAGKENIADQAYLPKSQQRIISVSKPRVSTPNFLATIDVLCQPQNHRGPSLYVISTVRFFFFFPFPNLIDDGLKSLRRTVPLADISGIFEI